MNRFTMSSRMLLVFLAVLAAAAYLLSVQSPVFRSWFVSKSPLGSELAGSGSEVEIRGKEFHVEKAVTPQEKRRGLGGRDFLSSDSGMLFEFPQAGDYSFWMKDMKFDLDIIWILGNRIVYIAKNVSYDSPLESIDPKTPADKVLEINAGLSDKFGFETGDEVRFKD